MHWINDDNETGTVLAMTLKSPLVDAGNPALFLGVVFYFFDGYASDRFLRLMPAL